MHTIPTNGVVVAKIRTLQRRECYAQNSNNIRNFCDNHSWRTMCDR